MAENKNEQKKRTINMKDRRVRKTIKSLRTSLIKLLETKSVTDITVSELTALADVNRSTFYFYYDDIFDMVNQLQDEIYAVFYETVIKPDEELHGVEAYVVYVTRFFEFCKENEIQCRFLLNNDINTQLMEKIMSDVKKHIPDSSVEYGTDKPEHYLTTYLISGIIGVIMQWMDDGMIVSPEEMTKYISVLFTLGAFKTYELKN